MSLINPLTKQVGSVLNPKSAPKVTPKNIESLLSLGRECAVKPVQTKQQKKIDELKSRIKMFNTNIELRKENIAKDPSDESFYRSLEHLTKQRDATQKELDILESNT